MRLYQMSSKKEWGRWVEKLTNERERESESKQECEREKGNDEWLMRKKVKGWKDRLPSFREKRRDKKKKVNRSASSSNLERSWKLFQAFHGWTDSSSSGGCCGGVNQRWPLSFPSTEYSRLFFRETRLLNHRITSSAGGGGGDFSRTTRKNNNHG